MTDSKIIADAIEYLTAEAWETGAEGSPHEVYLMHCGKLRREIAERLRGLLVCSKCGSKPVITNLDGDDLCSPCATKWVVAEGQAERDAQDAQP
jgi:hypothetical protein